MKRIEFWLLLLLTVACALHAMEPASEPSSGDGGSGAAAVELLEDDNCPICLVSLAQVSADSGPTITLPCHTTHRFHVHCLERLLIHGAPLRCPLCRAPVDLQDVLMEVVDKNNVDGVESLLGLGTATGWPFLNVNDQYSQHETLLHRAAEIGSAQMCEILINHGANVNARDNYLWAPIHLAATYGHVGAIALLLANGAAIDSQADEMTTPLHLAAMYGHVGAIALLLVNGAAINASTSIQATPLHLAAGNGHIGAVSVLISHMTHVDVQAEHQTTPLHWASANGHVDAIKILLANRANVNARDEYGRTPFAVADNAECAALLRAAYNDR